MSEIPIQIDELYRIYKQSKKIRIRIPSELGKNRIESDDLYFAVHQKSHAKGIKKILLRCYLFMDSNMPLLRKPLMPLFNKDNDYALFFLKYGDAYAKWCLKRGAAYAVIDDMRMKKGPKYLLVEDTNDALTSLAAFHRKKVDTQFIAITGSCGKTTTKELTKYILSRKYSTESTIGSRNAQWYIPSFLLNFDDSADLAVVEMGIASSGQIKKYCEIVQPHCGLITCIGKAHLSGLKSIEGVLKAKGELFEYLISENRHIFKNINDSMVASLARNYKNITTYGRTKDADICGEIISTFPFLKIKWYPSKKSRAEYYNVSTKLYGEYNLDNILSAISVALYFGVPPKLINEAIQEYETIDLRSQIKKHGTNTIYFDCYNANPTSMRAALISFAKMNVDKKVAIIGDMLELGNSSIQEHCDMISFVKKLNFDLTAFVGKEFMKARDNDFSLFFSNIKTARKWFNKQKFINTHIILKASRGIAIEKIINH